MADKLIEKLESEFPVEETNSFQMLDTKAFDYSSSLPKILKSIKPITAKICIISTSRQGEKVLNELKKNKINTKNLLVLSGIKEDNQLAGVKVYHPQSDITALKNTITFAIKNFNADIFIFDSITNLTLFLTKDEIVKFLQKFIAIMKTRNIQALFINILEETPDEISVRAEGVMDQRLSLEKFLGKKIKKIQEKKPAKNLIKSLTQKQTVDVKSLKKSISQLIKEEAKKISDETKKNLQTGKETKTEKKMKEKKKEVHKLENEQERLKLQKKLGLLQKSFELGVISEKSFNEGKRQIKAKMTKI